MKFVLFFNFTLYMISATLIYFHSLLQNDQFNNLIAQLLYRYLLLHFQCMISPNAYLVAFVILIYDKLNCLSTHL